jgi:peroxiredoxin
MKVKYKGIELDLIDEFAEVGYKAEKVKLLNYSDQDIVIGGQHHNKEIQLFISLPEYDNEFMHEIEELDNLLSDASIPINTFLITKNEPKNFELIKSKLSAITPLFDTYEEFGTMYGTKIETGKFEGKLAKSIFIIGKDGAIYFENIFSDMSQKIDSSIVIIELNRAAQAYTGVGCHG